MHARPEVKRILISQKLRRWASIGRCPAAYPNARLHGQGATIRGSMRGTKSLPAIWA